ncbi:hypothetical protein ES319_A13G165700v1 [Gossypium barbadense]|uniref:Uncharacterized protein n=1 Tax=Gossypium barbadense TaxID=3634 RepID=A0A5J5T072_GOSBA|nr:hypothetical protein ES319_A13G165700v1 [Gossypium barbadense]
MKLTETKHKTKKQKSKRSLGETRYDDSSSHVRKQNGPSNQQGDPMVAIERSFDPVSQCAKWTTELLEFYYRTTP